MNASRSLSLSVSSEHLLASEDVGGAAAATDGLQQRRVRMNMLARGLARRYSDQKGRSEALLAKVSRQRKQLAILAEYNRRKDSEAAEHEARSGARSQDVNAVVCVAPQRGPAHFRRSASLRLLADNQESTKEGDNPDCDALQSPTEEDLARFAALTAKVDTDEVTRVPVPATKCAGVKTLTFSTRSTPEAREALARGSSTDKSSAQVLCELQVTKEIVVREQTLQQLRQLVSVLTALTDELGAVMEKKAAASALLTLASSPPVREKRGSLSSSMTVVPLSTRRPESGQASAAAVERDLKEHTKQFNKVADKVRHRMRQFWTLLETLRDVTMNAVETIIEWRRFRERRCRFTNFQPLYRFPWRKAHVANYLLHVASDTEFLFQTAALRVALGPDLAPNPLLLSRSELELLGLDESSCPSTTFLTERREQSDESDAKGYLVVSPHTLAQHYKALLSAMAAAGSVEPPSMATVSNDRAQRCLEILRREQELESAEAERSEQEQRRASEAYNPFATIKAAGGVEESLAQVQLLEKRKEQATTTPDCEVRSVQAWGVRNKLPGKLVVRKLTVRRQHNQHARKIQLQYRLHCLRREMLQGLARFVATTRQSALRIQRIFRGYRAKKRYDIAKMLLEIERRRVAAGKMILHAYRRYRRRLRHRRSMTVESIAQAQLFCIQYHKLQEESDEDSVDRLEQLELEQRRNQSATKIQACMRAHLAKCELAALRKEKNAHVTAICILTLQSNVRKFLRRQEERRQRFREDLARVNRSADNDEDNYDEEDIMEDDEEDARRNRLPLNTRLYSVRGTASHRSATNSPATPAMARVELKLKEPMIGDDFDAAVV
ncbi:hypothetical protein PybrP1_005654, partial [[Pythium] brassicae (nom. inval.)]